MRGYDFDYVGGGGGVSRRTTGGFLPCSYVCVFMLSLADTLAFPTIKYARARGSVSRSQSLSSRSHCSGLQLGNERNTAKDK